MSDSNGEKFNLTRLTKLLKMTTSTTDAEALVAIRLANAEVTKLGTDWEGILSGRITIVADPFDSIPEPPRSRETSEPPPPPSRPQPAGTQRPFSTPPWTQPQPAPTPKPVPNPTTSAADWIRQHKKGKLNAYKSRCHKCINQVGVQEGFLVDTGSGWKVECYPCYTTRPTNQQSVPKSKDSSTTKSKTIDPKDLANILS